MKFWYPALSSWYNVKDEREMGGGYETGKDSNQLQVTTIRCYDNISQPDIYEGESNIIHTLAFTMYLHKSKV